MKNTENSSLPLYNDLNWVTSSRAAAVSAKSAGPDQGEASGAVFGQFITGKLVNTRYSCCLPNVQEVLILRRPRMAGSSDAKNAQDNMTPTQLKVLRKLVEQEFGNG